MKKGDIVMLMRLNFPVIGQIVALTPKRMRVAIRTTGSGYYTVLRAPTNLKLAKKVKGLL